MSHVIASVLGTLVAATVGPGQSTASIGCSRTSYDCHNRPPGPYYMAAFIGSQWLCKGGLIMAVTNGPGEKLMAVKIGPGPYMAAMIPLEC